MIAHRNKQASFCNSRNNKRMSWGPKMWRGLGWGKVERFKRLFSPNECISPWRCLTKVWAIDSHHSHKIIWFTKGSELSRICRRRNEGAARCVVVVVVVDQISKEDFYLSNTKRILWYWRIRVFHRDDVVHVNIQIHAAAIVQHTSYYREVDDNYIIHTECWMIFRRGVRAYLREIKLLRVCIRKTQWNSTELWTPTVTSHFRRILGLQR